MKTKTLLHSFFAIGLLGFMTLTFSAFAGETITFTGKNLEEKLSLKEVIKHTIYQEVTVPKTCTREEIIGYENHCSIVMRDQCETTYERECYIRNHRQCIPTTRQECHWENHPICTPIVRNECHNESVCRDVPDRVCRGSGPSAVCTSINRRVCENRPVCRNVHDRVCRDNRNNVCRTVFDEICTFVPREECSNVARQHCVKVPEEVCQSVPKTKTVSYDCSYKDKVPAGEEIDYTLFADTTVRFKLNSTGFETLKPEEVFELELKDQSVSIRLKKASKDFLVFLTKKEQGERIEDGAKQMKVDANLAIEVLPVNALKNIFEGSVTNLSLQDNTLSFDLGKVTQKDLLSIQLTLARKRFLAKPKLVFDGVVLNDKIRFEETQAGTRAHIDLNQLSLQEGLKNKKYAIEIRITPAHLHDKLDRLLNREDLPKVTPLEVKDDLLRE